MSSSAAARGLCLESAIMRKQLAGVQYRCERERDRSHIITKEMVRGVNKLCKASGSLSGCGRRGPPVAPLSVIITCISGGSWRSDMLLVPYGAIVLKLATRGRSRTFAYQGRTAARGRLLYVLL